MRIGFPGRIAVQPFLAGLQEVLAPSIVQIWVDAFPAVSGMTWAYFLVA